MSSIATAMRAGGASRDLQRLYMLDGTEPQRVILVQMVWDSAQRARAEALVQKQNEVRQQQFLRYKRGDVTDQQFTSDMSAAEQRDSAELRARLGPALHADYQQRVNQY